ncbi:uncharacterized protein DEA37_0000222 [Paragonimus westermani]|uniref:Fibronectin type-III domain-containing protein n=1 Tax=Paragonimus westermani TaxID=34504 RepID=A0A5J4P0L7_9TREM|nr:uncharacterized protein DEA37_0000222 [Paragonimus westermani]
METNTETVQIRDLKTSETYYIKVASSNSVDTGPFTEALPVIIKFGIKLDHGLPNALQNKMLEFSLIDINKWKSPRCTQKDLPILTKLPW